MGCEDSNSGGVRCEFQKRQLNTALGNRKAKREFAGKNKTCIGEAVGKAWENPVPFDERIPVCDSISKKAGSVEKSDCGVASD